MHQIARLAKLCTKWGGELKLVSRNYWLNNTPSSSLIPIKIAEAPFKSWHGLDWHKKIIYAVDEHVHPAGVLHEMGHVFACDDAPGRANEFQFFGWEFVIARKLGFISSWFKDNADYVITNDCDVFGNQTLIQRKRLLNDRIKAAMKIGLLVRHKDFYKPLAIR